MPDPPRLVCEQQSEAPVSRLASREEQLVFWIHEYNRLVHAGILAFRLRESVWEVADLFSRLATRIGDEVFTADEIEHGVLRGNRPSPLGGSAPFPDDDLRRRHAIVPPDPRVHFAISCGARSCPVVRQYSASELDPELDRATRHYLAGTVTLEPDGTVTIPELFRWYRRDFDEIPGGMVGFLLGHVGDGAIRAALSAGARIAYRPWDWSLKR